MKIKKSIVDGYYKHVEETYCCKTLDELLGKKYIIGEEFGSGNFSRMKIEEGLEISKLKINSPIEIDFDNRYFQDEILEVGYCYGGHIKIFSFPDNREYELKGGDIFIYKTLNNIDYFKFKYEKCKTVSITMNFNTAKNTINPIWEDRFIVDWQENINNMFKGNILLVEKNSYNLKQIAEQIDSISIDNVMGYMKLKLKAIEFITTLFEEKFAENSCQNSKEEVVQEVIRAKDIIGKNLENPPSVKELASDLNISVYKLQKGFKNITGNTVYEYIKKARIHKAEDLLKNTNMTIMEITNELGYENPSKFANLFKRYNNITPLKYRKLQ
ncbi:helix-turn-helix domain-containing protein [Anaeromicrobium sediminis]|uniref:AraC family transcriptional regulator n=1 Tax=Anaeromicrobium sediminis TaxID=1478221 RepID=A0A267MMM7_9FIRM|nr:AraC family transcriptional regulator [Anaeromicrobium sediminis]PAB60687.1 AraC family transcriptional regulator [Anaeromicrobium sediminis]